MKCKHWFNSYIKNRSDQYIVVCMSCQKIHAVKDTKPEAMRLIKRLNRK